MPNHVKNRLTAPREVIDAIWHNNRKQHIDFNDFIPMPERIRAVESVHSGIETAAEIALGLIDFKPPVAADIADIGVLADRLHVSNAARQLAEGTMAKDFSDEEFETFVAIMRAYRETGFLYWYPWCNANWGTKWNAYDCELINETTVEFQTAWAAPHPVIEAMAARFPAIELFHAWADEDTGANCGRRAYLGELTHEARPGNHSKDAFDLAFDLWPEDRKHYQFAEAQQTYVYHEATEPTT